MFMCVCVSVFIRVSVSVCVYVFVCVCELGRSLTENEYNIERLVCNLQVAFSE